MTALFRLSDALRHRFRKRAGWTHERATGALGEDLAHRFLRRKSFQVVARNYRPRSGGAGEIDLIAWDGGNLVFIEVKTRGTDEYGSPDRAIDAHKRIQIERVARDYARRANVPWDRTRFDVVTVLSTVPPALELLKDAFGSESRL